RYPGCVYSEMKMCLAPCFKGCSDDRYAEESAAVENFLATRGESRLLALRAQRDEASANLEFERAAALHTQVQRVESVRALAAELVRPLSRLCAIILQPAANPDEVAVFCFEGGCLRGPTAFSTLGMRIQNEQSGSTSLFAQPLAIEPVPEEAGSRDQESGVRGLGSGVGGQGATDVSSAEGDALARPSPAATRLARGVLESRLQETLGALCEPSKAPSAAERQGHLALLKRWYYRPETRRNGEIFFPDAENHWPIKAVLRGIGRVAASSLISRPSMPTERPSQSRNQAPSG
ncbi:MAG: UvrB/UvrC motif-containing protein, partial [Steroidobacteraceae bacterium]